MKGWRLRWQRALQLVSRRTVAYGEFDEQVSGKPDRRTSIPRNLIDAEMEGTYLCRTTARPGDLVVWFAGASHRQEMPPYLPNTIPEQIDGREPKWRSLPLQAKNADVDWRSIWL